MVYADVSTCVSEADEWRGMEMKDERNDGRVYVNSDGEIAVIMMMIVIVMIDLPMQQD